MVARHPAHTAHDVVLRRKVLAQRAPLAALPADRQITNDRLAAFDGVPRSPFAASLPRPRDDEQVLIDGGGETRACLVLRHVALESLRERRRRHRKR